MIKRRLHLGSSISYMKAWRRWIMAKSLAIMLIYHLIILWRAKHMWTLRMRASGTRRSLLPPAVVVLQRARSSVIMYLRKIRIRKRWYCGSLRRRNCHGIVRKVRNIWRKWISYLIWNINLNLIKPYFFKILLILGMKIFHKWREGMVGTKTNIFRLKKVRKAGISNLKHIYHSKLGKNQKVKEQS
jgi:hypothetical protein